MGLRTVVVVGHATGSNPFVMLLLALLGRGYLVEGLKIIIERASLTTFQNNHIIEI